MSGRGEQAAAWIYRGVWGAIVRWLRVPPDPDLLPVRAGETLEVFHPALGYLQYTKFWFWFLLALIDGMILFVWAVIMMENQRVGLWLLAPFVVVAVVPDVLAYIAIHLRYDTIWYIMTPRALRIRRGVWTIQESTVTFENVQNVRVSQGPVQRWFGFSDVVIETAGSQSGPHGTTSASRAVIMGIADAPALRDRIMARVRASRSAGLGDDCAPAPVAQGAWSAAHVAALRAVHDEAAALRATLG